MTNAMHPIFTVGHSTHELGTFMDLLTRHGVTAVADVRSQPFSRIPHFNRNVLSAALKARGVKYVPLSRELGARREEQECYINGEVAYERVALLPLFREGIDRLLKGAEEYTIALMCAEREPLDCHRTVLICQHLRPHTLHMWHILANGELEEHAQTERRMVRMVGIMRELFQQNLSEDDLIEQAYKARGKQIAYRIRIEGAPNGRANDWRQQAADHDLHDRFRREDCTGVL